MLNSVARVGMYDMKYQICIPHDRYLDNFNAPRNTFLHWVYFFVINHFVHTYLDYSFVIFLNMDQCLANDTIAGWNKEFLKLNKYVYF